MKSPFPGMDPYLEQYWDDVHHALVTYARDQIQPQLPGDLRARMQERVFVEMLEQEARVIYPDVSVAQTRKEHGEIAESAVSLAQPVVLELPMESVTQGYIEIIDARSGSRVVTVIEFISPSNKLPGQGRELYLQKQQEVRAANVSLVEVDLTRQGDWVLSVPHYAVPRSHQTLYQVCVRRGWKPRKAEVYAVPLRQRLPIIRIPLRETDSDATLDLQVLIEQCYGNGRYGGELDYRRDLVHPLSKEDAGWANELLRSRSVR